MSEPYATCDEDYSTVDGSMYFLPRRRQDIVLNAGIVTEELSGSILIRFPIQYNIKGVTVEFGKAYPVDFTIESDNNTVEIAGKCVWTFCNRGDIYGGYFPAIYAVSHGQRPEPVPHLSADNGDRHLLLIIKKSSQPARRSISALYQRNCRRLILT